MGKNDLLLLLILSFCFFCVPAVSEADISNSPDWQTILDIGTKCSGLPKDLILSVIWVESGGNPNAININGTGGFRATTQKKAIDIMAHYNNANVDIGLMQINWKTWGRVLGLRPIDMLDPIKNVCYGSAILKSYIVQHEGSWRGVGRYNAVSYSKQVSYAHKVYKTLNRIKTYQKQM